MRNTGIDALRGVAAFGIVGCHLSLYPRTAGGDLVISLCDFNVGVFTALAGFLMWDKKGGWLEYAARRAKRLLPTYLVWTALFLIATALFDLLYDGGKLNPRYMTGSFWLRVLFIGGSSSHLWFLICLFYAQVLLFGAFSCFAGKRHGLMWIASGGALICGSALLSGWFWFYPVRLVAFLATGYGIRCCCQAGVLDGFMKCGWLVRCMALGMLALHVVGRGAVHGFVRDWLAVGPVLIAFAGLEIEDSRLIKAANVLGITSMGVYLVHPLMTRGLSVVAARVASPPYSVWVVLGEWIIAWLVSFVAALALLQIPVVKKICA